MARLALVLGGARSGKSAFAETMATRLAAAEQRRKIYLATARTSWNGQVDAEFAARIEEHRARRGADWITVEAPDALEQALDDADGEKRVLLVDCLTLWLSNRLLDPGDPDDAAVEAACDALIASLRGLRAPTILVSNEVGLGLTPETPLGRRFRDAQGALNRRVAAEAELAVFVAAGLPLTLKGDLRGWSGE